MYDSDEYTLTPAQRRYLPLKRAIDVVLSGGAIVILSPVLLGLAAAIKIESPGPVLFKQKRVGKDKKLFEIWKFRSMRTDTPKDVPTHMLENPDQYITKTGRFIRKTSLDELPQIFNIFCGQMSIVGPRPALWNQDDLIAERDKYGVNALTPGLTGWAQINGRDELEIPVKARLDGEYLQKMSLSMDLKCFLGTIGAVLQSDGVVEGGTGELRKEAADPAASEPLTDQDQGVKRADKVRKEIRTGALIVSGAFAVFLGCAAALFHYFRRKADKSEGDSAFHRLFSEKPEPGEKNMKTEMTCGRATAKAKTGSFIGAAAFFAYAGATIYTNLKRQVQLTDQRLDADSEESIKSTVQKKTPDADPSEETWQKDTKIPADVQSIHSQAVRMEDETEADSNSINETYIPRPQTVRKKILITGAGSYIGTAVRNRLQLEPERYEVAELDMQSDDWREADFSKYDVVYHVAGIAHADVGAVSEEEKQRYYQVNTLLAEETAKKAKKEGVKQFIFMSSMIVYSDCKEKHITQQTRPNPLNFYGDSKWQAEQKIRALEEDSFQVVILRPPMIYGKGSKGNYPQLAKIASVLPVFPIVKNKRSMLHIDNLCEFVKLMIDHEESGIFFPQNGEYTNTSDMVQMIAQVKGHRILMLPLTDLPVRLLTKMPGKIGTLAEKAFGDSTYDMEMSDYKENYRIRTLRRSIELTEG